MLTQRIIRDAKPGPKPRILWDAQIKGLGCKIHPSGRKTFVLSFRIAGRKRLATLVRCSDMRLVEARDLARAEIAHILSGGPDPLERRRREREAPTVNDALTRFFSETVPDLIALGRLKESTARQYKWLARRYVAPALGTLRVSKVTRHDVERLASTLLDRPSQHNAVLRFISRLFTQTEHWEWRPQRTNPARGIVRNRMEPRSRILSGDEFVGLSSVLKSAEEDRAPSVAAIRVAALTGLRISEVIAMRWVDVDFASGRVTLPDTKTGPRVHDLPSAALALMSALPRFTESIFAYSASAPVTYDTVRRHFSEFAAQAGLKNVRLHDLRRTLITRVAASGASAFVIRDLLGHKTVEVALRYVQESGLEVRQAREHAARSVAAIMDPPESSGGSKPCETGAKKTSTNYSRDVRERAVRLVLDHQGEHDSQWAAIVSVSAEIGCTAETLRKWVRRAEIDDAVRPGLTSAERERLKALERENRKLRRANEILRKASANFARADLDRRRKT